MRNKKLYRYLRITNSTRFLSISRVLIFATIVAGLGGTVELALTHAAYSGNHAYCSISQTSKTTVQVGETFTGLVHMHNDGTTTWSAQYGVYLADVYNHWNYQGYTLSSNIAPGSIASFSLTLHAPTTPGTYPFASAMAIATLGRFPYGCGITNITVLAKPTPTPTPTPKPKPKPTPKPSPTPQPTPNPQPTNSGGQTATDRTPPSVPKSFTAKIDDLTKSIDLSWQASSDNVKVAKYTLERSQDKHKWDLLGGDIQTTSYIDLNGDFNVHYYYRLQAIDTSDNKSGYATADITSSDFTANALKSSDATIISQDAIVSVLIPAGALSSNAFCALAINDNITTPIIDGYKALKGPYSLSCRDTTGKTITNFNIPLVLTASVNANDLKGVSEVKYYGQQADGTWSSLNISSHDQKSSTDTIGLDGTQTFTIMGKLKKKALWISVVEIIVIIAGLLALLRFVMSRILKRRIDKQKDDYFRKSHGL